jgi:hypothetical protein
MKRIASIDFERCQIPALELNRQVEFVSNADSGTFGNGTNHDKSGLEQRHLQSQAGFHELCQLHQVLGDETADVSGK